MSASAPLEIFVDCLKKVPDPRSKHGTSHPFPTLLAVTLLGLLANVATPTAIARWTKIHLTQLKQFLRFRNTGAPSGVTFSRVFQKLSLDDLQNAFAEFLKAILDDTPIAAAVDGKVAKQMKDENGDPILMLNIFAQNLKLHLVSWSVRGDKTNEPGCLKQHLEELFTMYPCLKLLTGDAIYAQRPLLEAIQEYHRDYLVQIKDNQEKTHQQMKLIFEDAPKEKPSDQKVAEKGHVEIRRLWLKKWAADFVREELKIPGCRSLIRLDKEVRREGKLLSLETRYFLSSLDPDEVPASAFQDYILRHWEVENCLHWQKDRYFEEDKHVVRRPGLGKVWTVLTNVVLSLARLLRNGERTLREVHEKCHADPTAVAERLGFLP